MSKNQDKKVTAKRVAATAKREVGLGDHTSGPGLGPGSERPQ
jgi:hypothetical protein